jgi:hypothetical protein
MRQGKKRTPSGENSVTRYSKITKSNGKYVLEDLASKTPFALDDQKAAKRYDGGSVIVTGSWDTSTNTTHVQKIEAAA